MILRLLPALGADPGVYDAERVRRVILDETERCSPAYVKTMSMALRGYLRVLAARSVYRPGLDHAVPPAPCWRLSALPRYLPAADIERLIDASSGSSPCQIRDRAILLLLARLVPLLISSPQVGTISTALVRVQGATSRRPSRKSRRQENSNEAEIPWRRAVADTCRWP